MGAKSSKSGLNLKERRGESYFKAFLAALSSFLLAFIITSILSPVEPSTATQELQATLTAGDYYVNVSAEPTVSLSISTTDFGNVVSAVNSLSASTNIPSGYQIYFSTGSNNEDSNRLYLNGDSSSGYLRPNTNLDTGDLIPASSPAPLGTNMWGYTISSTNVDNNLWSAVPVLGQDELVAEESSAGEYTETIYLGVKATTDMQSGSYTGTLAYTIIADAPIDPMNPIEIEPASGPINALTPVEIKVTLADASTTLEDLGTITAKINNEECTNPSYTIDTENSVLTISCVAPRLADEGSYGVVVTIERFGKSYTLKNGYTAVPKTFQNITYMQDMDSTICTAANEGDTTRLIDIRGRGNAGQAEDSSYGVIRAKDGNCWMRENFDLYNTTGDNAIKAEDSDFESSAYEIPASSNWRGNVYTEPKVHQGTVGGHEDQVYYNWTVAVALIDGSTTAQQDQSICPRNWQLPVNGNTSINKSYAKLYASYGIANATQLISNTDLGFTRYYDYWHYNGSESTQVVAGFYTSTPASSTKAYHPYYHSSSTFVDSTVQFSDEKGYGYSVRCVSRN